MNALIYLVRHCRAASQEPNAPLTAEGFQQAEQLAAWFDGREIARLLSSPYTRALQTIAPLAQRRGLPIGTDERLQERVFCSEPLPDWQERLAASYTDLDLCLPGGESSRTAMRRGVAALEAVLQQGVFPAVLVSHGNLLTLLWKHFDTAVGFVEWQQITNPDVFCLQIAEGIGTVERVWHG